MGLGGGGVGGGKTENVRIAYCGKKRSAERVRLRIRRKKGVFSHIGMREDGRVLEGGGHKGFHSFSDFGRWIIVGEDSKPGKSWVKQFQKEGG